jgi:death-on-curing protein
MQAAALAHGIAESQAFIDANKRTALAAMLTFLQLNGYAVAAPPEQLAAWILRLSEGGTIQELADALRPTLALILIRD